MSEALRSFATDRFRTVDLIAHRLGGRMQPRERGDHDLNPGFEPTAQLRPAAVLVGLAERENGLNVVLTRRTDHLEHHPGQICFPGGHVETDDLNPIHTALRETEEEIGFPAHRVDIIGNLDTYVTRTGFRVTPVVGILQPPLDFIPDPNEVAEVFEVPLAFVLDPDNHHRRQKIVDGTPRRFYALPYGAYDIWGATAGILVDFYQALMDENAAT